MNFSIIIPCLNEEKHLPELLEDLSNQSFKDFKVIVVDGKSDDRTVKFAEKFKSKLSLKIIKSNIKNVSYQRNIGAKNVKRGWIIFMDADNRLPYYFMEGIKYRILLENPDIFTSWVSVDKKKNPLDELITGTLNLGTELIRLAKYPGAVGSMIGITSEGYKVVGGFDPKTEFAEDWEFVSKAFSKGLTFKIFRDPKYYYSLRRFRRMGTAKTISKYAEIYLKSILKIKITQQSDYPMGGKV